MWRNAIASLLALVGRLATTTGIRTNDSRDFRTQLPAVQQVGSISSSFLNEKKIRRDVGNKMKDTTQKLDELSTC